MSQRKGSVQSLFMTTMSCGSALQSARGLLNNEQPVNLENTAELKAFSTIDLGKINSERCLQLRQALEENLSEKEKDLCQVAESLAQQREEYERCANEYQQKNKELDEILVKQKKNLGELKTTLREKEREVKEKETENN